MSKREALEGALLTHGSEWWDENDRGLYADELLDSFGPELALLDAGGFAHVVWAMGYMSEHEGHCRYRDEEDANDADYVNECAACKRELTEIGRKVLADLESGGSKS